MTEETPPPLVRTESLGDILAASLDGWNADKWDIIGAAVQMIAAHYRLDDGDVWGAIFDLEAETSESTGLLAFGRLLERPWGFSTLGLMVAETLLGVDEARALPTLQLSYH